MKGKFYFNSVLFDSLFFEFDLTDMYNKNIIAIQRTIYCMKAPRSELYKDIDVYIFPTI